MRGSIPTTGSVPAANEEESPMTDKEAIMDERIIASEALFGFAAWLTCRTQALMIGANYDAAPMAVLVKIWCDTNDLPEPRDHVYPQNIKQPSSD
mgnify:FL=1